MDLSLTVGLIVIAVLLFANAFFVASEFAIVKVRKTRILQLMHEGNKDAVSAYDLIEHMDNSLAAIQLGITIASIGLGWVGESTMVKLLEPLIEFLPISAKSATAHSIAVPFAFAFVTLAHVVIGELMPKSIAIQSTEKTSLVVAKPMNAIRNIFRPFTWILNGFGNMLLRIFKIEASNVSRAHSVEELDMIIDASHKEGVLNDTEKEIPDDTIVSMNMFGFTPNFLTQMSGEFIDFLNNNRHNLSTCEFFLPTVVSNLIQKGVAETSVLETSAVWFGITYREDKQEVEEALAEMVKAGIYPENLWN